MKQCNRNKRPTWKACKVGKDSSWPLANVFSLDFFLPISETSASNWRFLIRSAFSLTFFIGLMVQSGKCDWLLLNMTVEQKIFKKSFECLDRLLWRVCCMRTTLTRPPHTLTDLAYRDRLAKKRNCAFLTFHLPQGETEQFVYTRRVNICKVPLWCTRGSFWQFLSVSPHECNQRL